jgi:diketogulonate reductase-like aldo/keto reductase
LNQHDSSTEVTVSACLPHPIVLLRNEQDHHHCPPLGPPKAGDKLATLARERGISEAQLNIAWLLHKSPMLLPIPGTSSLAHLRENLAAADIQFSAEDMAYLG